MLHSLYTGIENIFKRIAVELDGGPPQGEFWHSLLLDSMMQPTPGRPAILSDSLRNELRSYVNFRHFFRHAYTFHLNWERMAPLVHDCETVLKHLETELDRFSSSLNSSP